MAEHNQKGKAGESLAAEYLKDRGYQVLERNWRCGHKEIDIIARKDGTLVVVEIKVRFFTGNERLEEHFTKSKQRNLQRAAEAYLSYRNMDMDVRFDIILIKGKNRKIEHIPDAFMAWD